MTLPTTELFLIAMVIIFTVCLLMAVASTMLTVPVVAPRLLKRQGLIERLR